MNPIFSNFQKVDNIGDLYACPADYLGHKFPNHIKTNFLDLESEKEDLILGGGGMLHGTFIKTLEKLINKKRKLIIWGAGINEHDIEQQCFPSFLNKYDLVGLRDKNNPWNYVPCPSCLHSSLNNPGAPTEEFVVYHHIDKDIQIDAPKRHNNRKTEKLEEIITFLSRGETIITNSYHGIYWALLIGRKVLVWEPFSNRFFGFKPEIVYCDRENWREKLKTAKSAYSGYLEECRSLNNEFCDKVLNVLS